MSTPVADPTPISMQAAAAADEKAARRATAKADREAARAAVKAQLETMTPEQRKLFRADLKAKRAIDRSAKQSNRQVRVKQIWLEGLATQIGNIASFLAGGKSKITYRNEEISLDNALSRLATAVRAEMVKSTAKKVVVRALDKVFVVVRIAPDGSKLADAKTYRGSKGEERAQKAMSAKVDFLQAAGISGYQFVVMSAAEVAAEGVQWSEAAAKAA